MPNLYFGGSYFVLSEWKEFNQFFKEIAKESFQFYTEKHHISKRKEEYYVKLEKDSAFGKLTISALDENTLQVILENCMIFTLKNAVLNINSISRCDYATKGFYSIRSYSNTKKLLILLDKLAIFFGCNKITLTDDAVDLDFLHEKGVYFSLVTVMSEGKLFYEKYGYTNCSSEKFLKIDLSPHINLLRTFPFKIFLQFLSTKHRNCVLSTCHETQFNYLHEFFTTSYNECKRRHSLNPLDTKYVEFMIYIQNKILLCKEYPWYSMMAIIFNQNFCMEKILNGLP